MNFMPLSGVRVLDFTWNVAGPTATKFLAQLGADVIKVEWPRRPDPGRHFTFSPIQEGVIDSSGFFADLNVGKRSFTVDTKSRDGHEIVDELLRRSDIVIESFSPGVMASWGWSSDRMRELNPELIYLSLSGFGHTGPYGDYVAYGPTAQAASGVTFCSGDPDKQPAGWGFSYLDLMAGYQAAWALVAALRHQRAGGGGQYIDLSQLETGASMIGAILLDQTVNRTTLDGGSFPPGCRSALPQGVVDGFRFERGAPYNLYRTNDAGDDGFCAITVLNDRQWVALRKSMGNPVWADRPEFADMEGRIRNQDELDRRIGEWARGYGKYELMALLQAQGVPAGAMQTGRDRLELDPSLLERGALGWRTHPVVGTHRFTSIPVRVDDHQVQAEERWPILGQHTYAVLTDQLRMSDDQIAHVEGRGALWPKDDKPTGAPDRPSEQLTEFDGIERDRPIATTTADALPLAGVRVVEIDDGVAQYAGKLLADLGAEVIKVEPPQGSGPRHVGPYSGGVPDIEKSIGFWYYNAGKRSVVVDLDSADGRGELFQLVQSCDLVLDGLAPSQSDAWGIARLLDELPEPPVHVAVSRFGRSGPWRNYTGSDLVSLALGGVVGQTGYDAVEPDPAQPVAPTGGQSVHYACVIAATAAVAALLEPRERRSREIDVAVHDTIAMSTEIPVSLWEFGGTLVKRHTGRHSAEAPHTPRWQHLCRDGRYVCALPLYLNDRRFSAILEWFDSSGQDHGLRDDRYASQAQREKHLHELTEEFAAFCATQDSDDVFHGAQQRSIPWAKIMSPVDLVHDAQLHARSYFTTVSTPDGEVVSFPKVSWIGMASQFDRDSMVSIPSLGSSTRELVVRSSFDGAIASVSSVVPQLK